MSIIKKLDIIEELFFDDILDIWDHISELKSYYPHILYYANFIDYYNFVICHVLELEPEFDPGYFTKETYTYSNLDNLETNRIYQKFYEITLGLIKEINKQLSQNLQLSSQMNQPLFKLSKGLFYDWINHFSCIVR